MLPSSRSQLGYTTPGRLRDTATGLCGTVEVTTDPTLLVPYSPRRNGLFLVNNGSIPVWLGFSGAVTPGTSASDTGGWLLRENGGAWGLQPSDAYVGPVYGVVTAGSSVVAVAQWEQS